MRSKEASELKVAPNVARFERGVAGVKVGRSGRAPADGFPQDAVFGGRRRNVRHKRPFADRLRRAGSRLRNAV
jgi:hypothetical protein